jgi:hypothetical protein
MEKELSQEQSLEMIKSMISISRQNFRKGGFYYILWGSLFFVAALVQYVLYTVYQNELHYLTWGVAGGLAIIINIILISLRKNKPRVKTYIDRMNYYLWTAFIFSILFIAFLASQRILSQIQINPLIIMLYGFATFISGGMLRFRWLIAGAIVAWIIAIYSSFQDYGTQMLLVAITILLSYLIPGILLNFTKENHA